MEFLKKNYIYISILSILIFSALVIFAIFKDKFTDVPPYSDNKKVKNIETFNNEDTLSQSEAFCKKYQPTPHLLKSHCKKLGVRGCHIPKCCILLHGKECVPGDHHGPTFRTDNGNPVTGDFFHHQEKCHDLEGKCPN